MIQAIEHSWGYASHDMYTERWALIREHITGPNFVLVDWGSDAGWFSLKIAHDFPEATVVSVEAGLMSSGEGFRMHEEKLNAYGITNNILVNTLFGPDTFDGHGVPISNHQLALSVFHHFGDGFGRYLGRVTEWDATFCDLVSGSNVTFLEIPNENNPNETPHRIRKWYGGRDVETVIRTALTKKGIKATVEVLGEVQHGTKGARKLFKISLDEPATPASAVHIAAYISSVGQHIRIRPYRRFRFFLSRLVRKVRASSGPIARKKARVEQTE